jgi:hypothetical protein
MDRYLTSTQNKLLPRPRRDSRQEPALSGAEGAVQASAARQALCCHLTDTQNNRIAFA